MQGKLTATGIARSLKMRDLSRKTKITATPLYKKGHNFYVFGAN